MTKRLNQMNVPIKYFERKKYFISLLIFFGCASNSFKVNSDYNQVEKLKLDSNQIISINTINGDKYYSKHIYIVNDTLFAKFENTIDTLKMPLKYIKNMRIELEDNKDKKGNNLTEQEFLSGSKKGAIGTGIALLIVVIPIIFLTVMFAMVPK